MTTSERPMSDDTPVGNPSPDLDDVHGSSDIPKIATKAVLFARAFDQSAPPRLSIGVALALASFAIAAMDIALLRAMTLSEEQNGFLRAEADLKIVILTGDNGPTDWARYYREGVEPPGSSGGYRGRKWSLYEGGIREPLIDFWLPWFSACEISERQYQGMFSFTFPASSMNSVVAGLWAEPRRHTRPTSMLATASRRLRTSTWSASSVHGRYRKSGRIVMPAVRRSQAVTSSTTTSWGRLEPGRISSIVEKTDALVVTAAVNGAKPGYRCCRPRLVPGKTAEPLTRASRAQ